MEMTKLLRLKVLMGSATREPWPYWSWQEICYWQQWGRAFIVSQDKYAGGK